MKKRMWRKMIAGLLVAACLLTVAAPALAAEETEYGLTVTASEGGDVRVKLTEFPAAQNGHYQITFVPTTLGTGLGFLVRYAGEDNYAGFTFESAESSNYKNCGVLNPHYSTGLNSRYNGNSNSECLTLNPALTANHTYTMGITYNGGKVKAALTDQTANSVIVESYEYTMSDENAYINGTGGFALRLNNGAVIRLKEITYYTALDEAGNPSGVPKTIDYTRYAGENVAYEARPNKNTENNSSLATLTLVKEPGTGTEPEGPGSTLIEGLAGYWTFDGDTPLANHAEGSTITATLGDGSGVATRTDGGIHAGSVYFSGLVNSPLKLNLTDAGQGFNASTDDFTLATWVNYDNGLSGADQVDLFQQTGDGKTILYLRSGGTYTAYLTGNPKSVSTTTPVAGKWHHIVLTWDHTSNTMTCYINGKQEVSAVLEGSAVNKATDIWIGAHKSATQNQSLKGYVDELRYYTRALTAGEALALYQYNGYNEILEALSDVTIAVEPATKVRDITPAMFGINHRYHKNGYGTWDAATASVNDTFTDMVVDGGYGSIRWPGGTVSNLFTWKDSIGPLAQRTPTIAGNNFYSDDGEVPVQPGFGLDEAAKWIVDDLGVEMIYVYGMGRGNAQDAADLVEYLNAPNDGSNPGGGVDWAKVRADNGHEEPYNITKFEIGNEFTDVGQNYWATPWRSNEEQAVEDYIEGGIKTFTGVTQYYQVNDRVVKKGDWRKAASFSDGQPGEVRYVCYTPVVNDSAYPVTIKVNGTPWQIVESLAGQSADAQVCTFDYEEGKITFGDGVNGKIPPSGQQITANYSSDRDGFAAYYDAMKAIANEIKGLDIKIYSGIHDGRQSLFIDKMHAKGYDNKYDGVIYHPYTGTAYTESSYNNALTQARAQAVTVGTLKTKMDNTSGFTNKEVAVSEFGINTAAEFTKALGNALYTANHMIDCVNNGAAYQNRHCLVDFTTKDNLGSWQQCVIQCHGSENGVGTTNQYVATPSARAFSIFNYMTGNVQIGHTVMKNDNYHTSNGQTVQKLNLYTTRDSEGNVYVLVVNNQKDDTQRVHISVEGEDLTDKEIDVWCLTSESVMDQNTLEDPDKVAVEKTKVTADDEALTYTLAAHSITSFKISGVEVPPEPDTGIASITVGETTTTTQPWDGEPWFLELPEGSELPAPEDITVVTADAAANAVVTRGDGEGKYIITVTAEDGTTSKEYTLLVTIYSHEHKWGSVKFWWRGSSRDDSADKDEWLTKDFDYYVENVDAIASATRVCTAADEEGWETKTKQTATMKVEITAQQAPTCEAGGTLTVSVTAAFDGDPNGYTADHTFAFDATGHKFPLIHVEAKEATTSATGLKEHWKCEACGKLFLDAEAKTETTLDAVTIPKKSSDSTGGGGTGGGGSTGGGGTSGGGGTGGGAGGGTAGGGGGTTEPPKTDDSTTTAKKVTSPEGDVTITVTDSTGEEIAKVTLPATIPTPDDTFIDLSSTPWAEDAINHMAGLKLVNGVGGSKYDPTASMTRGSLATVLYRLSNGKNNYAVTFNDVAKGQYYTEGVAWATKAGVVTGYSADTFAPNDTITREQLAVMLARYAKLIGMDTTANKAALDKFTDGSATGGWAADGMAWCVEKGILQGKGANNLDPTAKVTRAEVAVMLDRFLALVK